MTDPSEAIDGEVLRLRSTGQAFARISRDLRLEKPVDAQRAFQRAVRRLPPGEQAEVREQESSRLDRLAEKVNADTDKPLEEKTRRLAAVERLRGLLTSDSS
jgi:acyl-CoA reductase-like NAD-dependent aldehyde dehydrogenase